MGTETQPSSPRLKYSCSKRVKLNNPQMGTETGASTLEQLPQH